MFEKIKLLIMMIRNIHVCSRLQNIKISNTAINYTSMSHEVLIYLLNAHKPAVHCTS